MSISWLWGGNKSQKPEPPSSFSEMLPPPPPPGGSDGGNNMGGSGEMQSYRFDSSALERAATAAKSLENSPNAKEYLKLSLEQEIAKGNASLKEAKELEIHLEMKRAENYKKSIQDKLQADKNREEYHDQLTRKREQDGLERNRVHKEEMLRMEQDAHNRKIERDRQAFEDQMKRQAELDMNKIQQEALARGKVERENQDLILERIRVQAKEDREQRMESIKSIGAIVGNGFNTLLGDKQKLQMAVGGIVAVAAGYLFAKKSLNTAFMYLEARMMTPALVSQTSRVTPVDALKHPVESFRKLRWRFQKPEDVLKGVILSDDVQESVRDLAIETKICRKANGFYRNALLHGPPGTGKTLFAKKLALHSGLDYAILSGGDAQVVGNAAVDGVQKLFRWAETSRRGLLLFIDEAEAFLPDRRAIPSQVQRETLSTFLTLTGTPNKKFMLVLTSNLPEEFDQALMNRIAVTIEFRLPQLPERVLLIAQYFQEFILQPAAEKKMRVKVDISKDWKTACQRVAEMAEGLSGREIAHLAQDWQMKTVSSESGEFTEELMLRRTRIAIERKRTMEVWRASQENKLARKALSSVLAVEKANPLPSPES